MSDAIRQAWAPIFAATERMLAQAREGRFDEARAVETERRRLLDEVFRRFSPADDPQFFRTAIERVLAADRALMDLGRRVERELSDNLQRLRQGRRATAAYTRTTGCE